LEEAAYRRLLLRLVALPIIELIEKYGGHLGVRSSHSGRRTGTVFSLFLPVANNADLQ
jgi:hypothetical protein